MVDQGAAETDRLIAELEERIRVEYAQAEREIKEKLDNYLKAYRIKDTQWQVWVEAGERTKEEYLQWRTGQIAIGERWEEMRQTIAQDLLNVHQIALSTAGEYMPEVYALNHDYATYQIEHDSQVDTSYTLYNRDAARLMFSDEFQALPGPGKKVSRDIADGKALRWNNRHIQSVIMQAILQGNSIPDIATRLSNAVADSDRKAATRNARTMMTNAQNSGRLDSFRRAKGMGIDVRKQWVATLDGRTRHEHRMLDGMVADLDKPFVVEGEKIMKPGDPNASPQMVYNCFVGSDVVSTDSEVLRSYKHSYEGELFHVVTASGINFTCTPNHPILTPSGWVAVAFLNEGDDLLITSIIDDSGLVGRKRNVNHIHACFETLHDTLKRSGLVSRNSSLSVNFHGDIPTSDVEIVAKKGELGDAIDLSASNGVDKILLENPDEPLVSDGAFFQHFLGVWQTTLGFVRRLSKTLAFFGRSLGHSEIHRFGTIAGRDVGVSEYPINNLPTTTMIRSELLDGLTGKVFVDNIVSIHKISGSTHVYNLQTENGYYFVGNSIPKSGRKCNDSMGVIAKNCRCTIIGSLKGYERDLSDTSLRHNKRLGEMTYEEWKEAKARSNPILLPEEKADSIRAKYIREYRERGGPVRSGRNMSLSIDALSIPQGRKYVDGKDIYDGWTWDKGKYRFAIDQAISDQGFDGLPQVVGKKEFDDVVRQSGMIAQRSYVAPDQETLSLYRDSLLRGKWYVDCSVGDATEGQGMYTSSDYTGRITDGIRADMDWYVKRGQQRIENEVRVRMLDGITMDDIRGRGISEDDLALIKNGIRDSMDRQAGTATFLRLNYSESVRYRQLSDSADYIRGLADARTASHLADNPPTYKIETMTMAPGSRIIPMSELDDMMRAEGLSGDVFSIDLRMGKYRFYDRGLYATLHGYDAIKAEGLGHSGSYTVILNRTKTYILEDDA